MTTRNQIVACAREYLGTPFQHQGRSKVFGIDCVGLPICVARDLGLPIYTMSASEDFWFKFVRYDREPADDTVLRECKKHLHEVPLEAMQPGDVLCLRVPVPCHVGIVTDLLGQVGIIHAYSACDKVVEHNLDFQWRRRIAGVFQFPGVEN